MFDLSCPYSMAMPSQGIDPFSQSVRFNHSRFGAEMAKIAFSCVTLEEDEIQNLSFVVSLLDSADALVEGVSEFPRLCN